MKHRRVWLAALRWFFDQRSSYRFWHESCTHQIHWIVANGIKMTGMPAMGGHHSSEEIAALTVFVDALPGLSGEDYLALTSAVPRNAEHAPSSVTAEAEE